MFIKGLKIVHTYSRKDDKQKDLVVCSFSKKDTNRNAPKEFDLSTIVLTNYESNDLNTLKPYETKAHL